MVFENLDQPTATVLAALVGALVGLFSATVLKFIFDLALDWRRRVVDRRAMASAMHAELGDIRDRISKHIEWLSTGYDEYFDDNKITKDGQEIIELPEVFPIYDIPAFNNLTAKIGIFSPELVSMIVTTYVQIQTNNRRADRYKNKTRRLTEKTIKNSKAGFEKFIAQLDRTLEALDKVRKPARGITISINWRR